MGFISKSYDDLDSLQAVFDERQALASRVFRFWMEADKGDKNIIFLTDNPPIIEEHNLKQNGKFGNHYTCLKNLGQPCPLCDAGDRPSTVGFYAIIDRSSYTSKKEGQPDRVYKDTVKVLPVKFTGLKLLKKLSIKYDGLVFKEFEVSRSSAKAANTGDNYIKEAVHAEKDILSILGDKKLSDVIPDWEEYLKPLSAADLAVVVSGKQNGRFDAAEQVSFE